MTGRTFTPSRPREGVGWQVMYLRPARVLLGLLVLIGTSLFLLTGLMLWLYISGRGEYLPWVYQTAFAASAVALVYFVGSWLDRH